MNKQKKIIIFAIIMALIFTSCYSLFLLCLANHFVSKDLFIIQYGIYEKDDVLKQQCEQFEQLAIPYFVYEVQSQKFVIGGIEVNLDQFEKIKAKVEKNQLDYVIKKITYRDYIIDELLDKKDYKAILERMNYENISITKV